MKSTVRFGFIALFNIEILASEKCSEVFSKCSEWFIRFPILLIQLNLKCIIQVKFVKYLLKPNFKLGFFIFKFPSVIAAAIK